MLHRIEAPAGGREGPSGRTGGRTGDDAHIPLWRRITALFMLASLVILIAVVLATAFAATALLALFVLERAIAG
jgi:hypothetical protein